MNLASEELIKSQAIELSEEKILMQVCDHSLTAPGLEEGQGRKRGGGGGGGEGQGGGGALS